MRITILTKKDYYALITLGPDESVRSYNGRDDVLVENFYETAEEALLDYRKAVHVSDLRGWRVAHEGDRNWG